MTSSLEKKRQRETSSLLSCLGGEAEKTQGVTEREDMEWRRKEENFVIDQPLKAKEEEE